MASRQIPPSDRADDASRSQAEARQIAQAITAARRQAGMTQKDLALAMNTTQSVIATLESGRSLPRLSSIQRVARATGTSMDLSLRPVQPHHSQQRTSSMDFDPRNPPTFLRALTSRRSLIGATAALATSASLIGTASAAPATPAASPAGDAVPDGVQPDGSWAFTDDRGVTITLPSPPERVFANINAAAPLWDFGIRPIGVFAGQTAAGNVAWGQVDSSLPNLTTGEGTLDIEALVALQADLYITVTWSPDEPTYQWGIEPARYESVNAIVPYLSLAATNDIPTSLQRFTDLAVALGVDRESPELIAAQDAFANAVESLRAAADAADTTVLFTYIGEEDAWYAALTSDWADLRFYDSLGTTIVPVDAEPGSYWQELSREQALAYPSDILMNSGRDGMYTLDELQADSTFSAHPAVQAGQVGRWNQDFIMSYPGLTEPLEDLAAILRTARKVS
ncbi:MAG: ABC transporter substrate-binding protein [Thermomicrobiales bacterium]